MADESVRGGTDAVPILGDLVGLNFAQRIKLDVGGDGVSLPVDATNPLPVGLGGTDVVISANGTTGALTLTLPAVAGKTNYLTGFEFSGNGATAAIGAGATVVGIASGTMYYVIQIPAGIGAAAYFYQVQFTRPLPASAPNQAIVVVSPAPGAGCPFSVAVVHGFYR